VRILCLLSTTLTTIPPIPFCALVDIVNFDVDSSVIIYIQASFIELQYSTERLENETAKSKDWLARNHDNVSGTTCLSAECCSSELVQYISK
jgi:hypothetical protein